MSLRSKPRPLVVDPDAARAASARTATALADLVPELADLAVPAGSAAMDAESRHALARAEAGGHLVSVPRLAALAVLRRKLRSNVESLSVGTRS